ncbi:MAG: hypothetical protein QOI58_2044 [Thermoanaerobaculia bacterium]|jgi:hypothetical protein|nr:hypothetical protein [Thermoanaerobaculia bacterium]
MRKTILLFLLLALTFAFPMAARTRRLSALSAANPASVSVDAVDPLLARRLLGQMKDSLARRASTRAGVHASAIADSVSARILLIPAAGSVPGGGGSLFFRSDVTLVNYAATPQVVMVGLWPQGGSNGDFLHYKSISLPPQQFVTFQDFVGTTLGLNTLGSLIFLPFAGNNLDFNAAMDGFSRIYTKQPGSTGTVSQPFDAVDPDNFSVALTEKAIALGLRQDANYRTNFGIVNIDDTDHTFKVSFVGEKLQTTVTVTVKGFGMIQQGIPSGDYGAVQILYELVDPLTDGSLPFVSYASSTDNITGDGWLSLGSAGLSPDELDLVGY